MFYMVKKKSSTGKYVYIISRSDITKWGNTLYYVVLI